MLRRFFKDERGQIGQIILIIALAIIAIAVVLAVSPPVREMMTDWLAQFRAFWDYIKAQFISSPTS